MSIVIPSLRAAVAVPGWAKNVLWRNARAVPSLDLRFADNKSLVDAVTGASLITFNRASSGTFVGSDGVLQTAATDVPRFDHGITSSTTNLLLRSEEIGTSPWGTNVSGSVTYTANAIASPTGTVTADRVTATADFAGPNQFFSVTSDLPYAFSFYVKAVTPGSLNAIRVECLGSRFTNFNITTRTFSATEAGITSTSSVALADGWVRVQCLFAAPSTGSLAVAIYANTSADFYLWGAQLEQSATVGPYVPTTTAAATSNTTESLGLLVEEQRTNLLLRSEAIATSPWFGGANTTLSNNTGEVLDPAGGSTATKVVVSGGTGAFGQGATLTAVVHSGSIWLRCATGTISASLIVYLSGSPFTNIGTTNVTITTSWQRFSVVTSTATAAAYNLQLNTIAVGTVYAWGAQLEAGAFPTSYTPTLPTFVSRASSATFFDSTGTLQTAASGVARSNAFLPDSAGVFRSAGLLLEEARTNSIRNNTMVGAVAGTPGTAPTNWITGASTDLTRTVVGTGIENGVNYVDIRYTGTVTAARTQYVFFELSNIIAATSGQTWNGSVWLKIAAGSLSNITSVVNQADTRDSSVVYVNTPYAVSITPTATFTRFSASGAATGTTAWIQPFISFSTATSGLVDITLRIGLPQLELGAFATSPILTTTAAATRAADVSTSAAVTRSADVASITGTAFSGWYRQDEGTMFAEGAPGVITSGAFPRLLQISNSDLTSRIILQRYTSNVPRFTVVDSSVTQVAFDATGTWLPATNGKMALAVKLNDFAGTFAGNAPATDTSGSLPNLTQLNIGASSDGTQVNNGTIKRLTYWPTRLANTTLQQITQS